MSESNEKNICTWVIYILFFSFVSRYYCASVVPRSPHPHIRELDLFIYLFKKKKTTRSGVFESHRSQPCLEKDTGRPKNIVNGLQIEWTTLMIGWSTEGPFLVSCYCSFYAHSQEQQSMSPAMVIGTAPFFDVCCFDAANWDSLAMVLYK